MDLTEEQRVLIEPIVVVPPRIRECKVDGRGRPRLPIDQRFLDKYGIKMILPKTVPALNGKHKTDTP